AAHTFAAQQLDQRARDLLAEVFTMRATRLSGMRESGRLGWVRETGARVRLADPVVADPVPLLEYWATVDSPLDLDLLDAFLTWAYRQADFRRALQDAFPAEDLVPPQNLPAAGAVRDLLSRWIAGDTFAETATATNRDVDGVLRIHGSVISYSL